MPSTMHMLRLVVFSPAVSEPFQIVSQIEFIKRLCGYNAASSISLRLEGWLFRFEPIRWDCVFTSGGVATGLQVGSGRERRNDKSMAHILRDFNQNFVVLITTVLS
ncbi:hypothetical protein EV702DRAFT_460940 [Suillus placidus]|uniref:Uncharacterized protein n=1 Tax=Suillus placidus TaxID=48579 RepID=A0A9P7D0L0_9AGAM|nr:hypothetical protein EV702DRAFT_460940 [Suillus placidus]